MGDGEITPWGGREGEICDCCIMPSNDRLLTARPAISIVTQSQ